MLYPERSVLHDSQLPQFSTQLSYWHHCHLPTRDVVKELLLTRKLPSKPYLYYKHRGFNTRGDKTWIFRLILVCLMNNYRYGEEVSCRAQKAEVGCKRLEFYL